MSLVGKKAPLFSVPAVIDGEEIVEDFSLEQFIGKKDVIFFFYPKDFTFVCPTEILAFQEKLEEFEKRGVAVIGASCDTEESHLAWLNTPKAEGGIQGVTYPIIADPVKTVAHNFGVLAGDWNYNEEGELTYQGLPVAYRATFLIDKEGTVRHETVNDLPLGRNIDEMLRLIDALRHVEKYGEVCPANWEEGKEAMSATREGVASYLSKN
ncbi:MULTISPECIES: peroxiredoxin [Cyclobacterium]|uniref:Thioredoxin peroxidase n=1 Tax=Cyclobacterium marinum (strain ATCC 25205 / DSM 745 / LMG 13164 / NCIMB 1802) TaxID=880070 RepID=G0IX34_CYCMS|nr:MULTISPECIES: peroxiredoxin [Cyclobacterium]AEL25582.1 alkyl hydroperoxide reductase/ Thiol specific antioxidant/ Mal allergen [Cyclobacterium marinum DSM 745]MBI0401016.1 peroxiredoxin [Cyclobacterium marinum]MBR9776199.1 peroxiredoxin [Cytophagales bacterium]MDO6438109.1 peroxiredoxin [Cyclobacterium sp. 1_MG-2023]|tara:strand:+ start:179459 stop:180088 length:630 start_codon:yes stop_codon:yes gene_type:complete